MFPLKLREAAPPKAPDAAVRVQCQICETPDAVSSSHALTNTFVLSMCNILHM